MLTNDDDDDDEDDVDDDDDDDDNVDDNVDDAVNDDDDDVVGGTDGIRRWPEPGCASDVSEEPHFPLVDRVSFSKSSTTRDPEARADIRTRGIFVRRYFLGHVSPAEVGLCFVYGTLAPPESDKLLTRLRLHSVSLGSSSSEREGGKKLRSPKKEP